MAARQYPTNVLKQAKDILSAWNQISATLAFGPVNPAALTALDSEMTKLEAQLTDMRNRRHMLGCGLWDKVKRVRTGVKAVYGDDSSQYEMVGGTRLSERKSPARRAVKARMAASPALWQEVAFEMK